jgi:hypothetical protein
VFPDQKKAVFGSVLSNAKISSELFKASLPAILTIISQAFSPFASFDILHYHNKKATATGFAPK